MIYMIEIDYIDPATEGEWDTWYHTYVQDLVAVPGIDTAQRFTTTSPSARKHLAVYTLASLSVYAEPRYRGVGGGGKASTKWHGNIKRRRNLYDGIARVPEIDDDHALLVAEAPSTLGLSDILFVQLDVVDMAAAAQEAGSVLRDQVPFDCEPSTRFVAIAAMDAIASARLTNRKDVAVYRPSGSRLARAP